MAKNWPVLREKLNDYLPDSALVRGFVDITYRFGDNPHLRSNIYIPRGTSSSTLVVVTKACSSDKIQSLSLFWDPNIESDGAVAHLLSSIPSWDWEKPVYFNFIPELLMKKLDEILRRENLGGSRMWRDKCIHASSLKFREGSAKNYKVSGFTEKPLHANAVTAVYDNGGCNFSETKDGVSACITHLPSVGIYGDQENQNHDQVNPNGSLVSWVMMNKYGFSGNLFTVPEFRGQGLAQFAYWAMSERLKAAGIPFFVIISDENPKSREFHHKIGFEKACDHDSYFHLPQGMTSNDMLKRLQGGRCVKC
ncbi:hypothetical protein SK128_006747 [Halocaridina rubra]|uniref:N-acetyltransferase domain-containing protein n=1 Tax=Halocaridina rubra TaxID=373956 RepID=A0AAN8X2A0_HALRR